MKTTNDKFAELVAIMARLRSPNGCPWDQEQTHQSLTPYLLEEAHEVLEAIEKKDYSDLPEELGDLLMQIIFHAQIAAEENRFDILDVLDAICSKLIRRHPHVFEDVIANTSEEVLHNWEKIKEQERAKKGKKKSSLLSGLPKSLTALVTSLRLGEKTHRVGFDWPSTADVLNKVEEEFTELKEAIQTKDSQQIEDELGDLLFSITQLGRFLKIDSESALRKSCYKFTKRFQWIEQKCLAEKKPLRALSAEEWDQLWEKSKTLV